MSSNVKKISVFALALIFIGGVILAVLSQDNGMQLALDARSHEFWSEQIQVHGAQEAYVTFSKAVQFENFGLQHELAHVFGGALYTQEGSAGLIICDEQFDYGCFHEFLGRAIAASGIGSIGELNNTCIKLLGRNAGYCQHGIGHGVQSYYGYKEQDLLDSLALCDELPDNDPIGGCAGGVFMEYNLRTMLGDARVIRDDINKLAPCDALKEWQQKSCYFWQPQWWYEDLLSEKIAIESLFKKLGNRCDDILVPESRDFCYRGIGNLMQARGGDNNPVYCDVVSNEQQNRELCWNYIQ